LKIENRNFFLSFQAGNNYQKKKKKIIFYFLFSSGRPDGNFHPKMSVMTTLPCLAPIGHLVLPTSSPRLTPVGPLVWPPSSPSSTPVGTPSGQKIKIKKSFFLFWLLLPAGKEGKKYFGFRFSIPKIPELRGLRGRSRKKKKVFSA
jgi:hypothetical protein